MVPHGAGGGHADPATDFAVRPLTEASWDGFAGLVERHNGVWGGCWCLAFHAEGGDKKLSAADRHAAKRKRVREGNAHAALVFEADECLGWCQFGPTAELPRIKLKKAYEAELEKLPDWRITCFFVDRKHRGRGVAAAALAGAIREIAQLGGGSVESYPEDMNGRKTSSSFLHNGTVTMFERNGFIRDRRIGKTHWVMTRSVPDAGKADLEKGI